MLRHVISTNGGIQQVLGALDLSGKDLVNLGLWVSQLECTVPDVFRGKNIVVVSRCSYAFNSCCGGYGLFV